MIDEKLEGLIIAILIVGLAFLTMATVAMLLNKSGDSFNEYNANSSSQSFIATSSQTLTPIGEGITTSSASTYANVSLNFDGVDDYVNVSDSIMPENGTISMWIKPKGLVSSGTDIFSSNFRTRFTFIYQPNNKFGFSLGNPAVALTSGMNISDLGNWSNIIFSYKRINETDNTGYLYINGFLNLTTNFSDTSTSSTKTILGAFNNVGSAFFNGSIDDINIYNYTLSYQEAFALSSNRNIEAYNLNESRTNEAVYVWVKQNSNEVYFSNTTGIYNSTGIYPNANLIYNDSDDTREVSGLFVSSVGTVFSSFNGSLILSIGNNTNWTSKNIFICNDSSISNTTLRYQGIDEDSVGNLYLGEYTGGDGTERCAYVHKSVDGGITWTTILNASAYGYNTSRHIHLVQVDDNNDYVYVTTGDGAVAGYDANSSKLLRSIDGGNTWTVLKTGNYEYQYLVFQSTDDGCRLFGTDLGNGNKIVRTCDDIAFTDVKFYSQYEDAVLHAVSKDNNGIIYFGTAVESSGLFPTIYYSLDNGISWNRIRTNIISTSSGQGYSVMSNPTLDNKICYGLNSGTDNCFIGYNLINPSYYKWKLNENTGTIAYDSSGNGNNGTISGATWNNDGILNTLTSAVDYTISSTGTFTLLNNDYLYDYVMTSWSFNSNSVVKSITEQGEEVIGDNTSIVGMILTISLIGVVLYILINLFLKNRSRV